MNLYTIPRTQICSKVLGIFAEEEYEFRKFVCLNENQTAQDGDKLSEVEDAGGKNGGHPSRPQTGCQNHI